MLCVLAAALEMSEEAHMQARLASHTLIFMALFLAVTSCDSESFQSLDVGIEGGVS